MRVIRSLVFSPDAVEIQYMETNELRLDGYVFVTRSMSVGRGRDYDDEIEAVETAVDDLLADVLDDFNTAAPFDPRFDGGDDDDDDDDD